MKNTTPFAKQAANASLGAAAVGWLLPSVIRGYRENLAVDEAYLFLLAISGFSLLIMAIGVVLALMALYGIRQHGRQGSLTRAVGGLVLNGSGIAMFVIGYLIAGK